MFLFQIKTDCYFLTVFTSTEKNQRFQSSFTVYSFTITRKHFSSAKQKRKTKNVGGSYMHKITIVRAGKKPLVKPFHSNYRDLAQNDV